MSYFGDPTDLTHRPRMADFGSTLDFQRPMAAWRPGKREIGGRSETAGAREAFVIHRWQLLEITLEWTEREHVAVMSWLETVQDGATAFTFYPDRADLGTSYSVWLEAPRVGEAWFPEFDDQEGVWRGTFVLASTNGTRFDIRRFPATP